jgi:biotin carboxylase
MEEAKAKFGDDYSFWPDGYVLPQQWEQFSRFYETAGIPTPIILKPSRNAMGNGIKCITSIDQVELSDDYVQKQIPLAQQFVP